MIEFVGLVLFLGESHAMVIMRFEPSPNRFILGQHFPPFMVS